MRAAGWAAEEPGNQAARTTMRAAGWAAEEPGNQASSISRLA
jgi:hypothetical protein